MQWREIGDDALIARPWLDVKVLLLVAPDGLEVGHGIQSNFRLFCKMAVFFVQSDELRKRDGVRDHLDDLVARELTRGTFSSF